MKVIYDNLELEVIPDSKHEWLLETNLVANGYGTTDSNIRKHKLTKADELIEGKHFITVTNSNGGEPKTFWTKRGVIRLGFFIKTSKGKKFRDWAEDLVLNEIEKKPLTSAELLLQNVQILVEHENSIREIKQDIAELKAKQITAPEQYTIAGFASLNNIKIDLQTASNIGKKASKFCKDNGYLTGKVHDARYVSVKTYPVEALQTVFRNIGLTR